MALGPDIIEINTAQVAPATYNMSAAQIDDVARRASAEVKAVESAEAGSDTSGVSGASILIEGLVDTLVPGSKLATSALEFASERNADLRHGGASKPMTMDDHIKGSFKKNSSEGLMASVNGAVESLFGRGGTDAVSKNLTGGLGKNNEPNFPTNQDAANQLSRSSQREKIAVMKHHHKNALDSVPRAQAQLSAARHHAMQMAPGGLNLDLANGPRFNANEILQEAERNRQTTAGTVTG